MLLIPAPQYRKRRERPRRSKTQPYHDGLRIISVTVYETRTRLTVVFEQDMVWNETDVPTAFRVITGSGENKPCIGVISASTGQIELEFQDPITPGEAWELSAPMAGITPQIAWPQSGVVE